ncbi:MAG: 4-phosphoerythronate dehydrogenase [Planctomycetota bacterium]|jgi:erythronate-4-phosphate dehydrogenase
MTIKIAADENIPFVREACRGFGNVSAMKGREMSSDTIKDADCLLVRSVTRVNEELLAGSKVKFVGTATIGIDHIDCNFLGKNNIAFTSAPGSNANSVAQYITSALLNLESRHSLDLQSMTLGIVGVGNVGKLVEKKARALGMNIILNDPPREEMEGKEGFSDLAYLLTNSDVVTTHVPLEKESKYPTFKLADSEFFAQMKYGSFYINSSRGKVCDEASLLATLESGRIKDAVLDVWENEPEINAAIFDKISLGTPHIAGYSFDGKVNGTSMIVNRAREYFNIKDMWDAAPLLPVPEVEKITINSNLDFKGSIRKAVLTVYDIKNDDSNMRKILTTPKEERAVLFDKLRKTYPRRREFFNTTLQANNISPELKNTLTGLGFKTA